jgi:hypothetical protein
MINFRSSKLRRLAGLSLTVAGATMAFAPNAWADGAPPPGVSPQTGVSETTFNMLLPTGAACSGDSQHAGYRVGSYVVDDSMVPASQIASTISWDASGTTPSASNGAPVLSLLTVSGTGYQNQPTAANTGFVQTPPGFTWTKFKTDFGAGLDLYPGTWDVGIACITPAVAGAQSPIDTFRFWNTQFTFAATGDSHIFSWSGQSAPTPEVPYAVIMPVSAAAVIGIGAFLLLRRRRSSVAMTG